MKSITCLAFLCITVACQAALPKPAQTSYPAFLEQVKTQKKDWGQTVTPESRKYFFVLVNEYIPRYWGGTPWDFNGTTRTPGQGQIACGYFITNTLVDLGFPIERVKLAQAASSVLIQAVTTDIAYPKSVEGLRQYALARPDESVFIVGLDFHTGYVTRKGNSVYFIHSNYIDRKGVMKELVEKSAALANNKFFMIGSISGNEGMLQKWINND